MARFLLAGRALAGALVAWVQHIGKEALGRLMMQQSPDRVWGNLGQPNQLVDYLALDFASNGYLHASRLPLRQPRTPAHWCIWAMALVLGGAQHA